MSSAQKGDLENLQKSSKRCEQKPVNLNNHDISNLPTYTMGRDDL